MFDVDWMEQLGREVLRERTAALIAESCAWAVGLSDQPHRLRRAGKLVPSGLTVGERAATEQPLADDDGGRLDLGDARPGSFLDALGALGSDGRLLAERFDEEVLGPFVLGTCVTAADRSRRTRPGEWAELAHDVGEDGSDPVAVVRAGGWEAPLRAEAELLVLAALGAVPLIEVEAEGLPLSLVRAAEGAARSAVPPAPPSTAEELTGALFLAETAIAASDLTVPVPEAQAGRLLELLLLEGLDHGEVVTALPRLPVEPATVSKITALVEAAAD